MNFEQFDASDFAAWGVDYLKYANCNGLGLPVKSRFTAMRDALNKTGRSIYFSLSKLDGTEGVAQWGSSVANSWRTSVKVHESFDLIRSNFLLNNQYIASSGNGGWNDPDLLAIGLGYLSQYEEQT